jgi:hypothetical protein
MRTPAPFQDMEFYPGSGVPGDCMRASLATLLGISRDEVPHFYHLDREKCVRLMRNWLSSRGFCLVDIDPRMRPDCEFLALGPANRPGALKPRAHMVVMKGKEVLHDPNKSREGLITIDRAFVVVPISPRDICSVKPVSFTSIEAKNTLVGEMVVVSLDRDAADFNHLADQDVIVDGTRRRCIQVHQTHEPPFKKGEPIALVLAPLP